MRFHVKPEPDVLRLVTLLAAVLLLAACQVPLR
jgi:uncharacterized lipoprotein YajG